MIKETIEQPIQEMLWLGLVKDVENLAKLLLSIA